MKNWILRIFLTINIIKVLTCKAEVEKMIENTCSDELIIIYRLYPLEKSSKKNVNYICPYIKNDCCAFSSQKLIQIFWAKLSNPRLQRVLTRNLHHIELIIKNIQSVLKLFEKNSLPESEKYSAECLTSLEDMNEYLHGNLHEKLDLMFQTIKERFLLLYEFKKQFYCKICDREVHKYFKIFDRQTIYSFDFCQAFSNDFKDITWFLNYEIIKYFQTIRKYVLCYKDKNFLLIQNLDKFIYKRKELKDITDCRDNEECDNLCQRYSISTIADIFIGDIVDLKKMTTFLEDNKVDERGFIQKVEEEVKEFGNKPDFSNLDFFQDNGVEGVKKDIEELQMEFYEHTYKIYREKEIKKKLRIIKNKVNDEFDDNSIHQNFITINDSNVNLDIFDLVLRKEGLNPYTYLFGEDLYIVNSNLTLFINPISNAVPDLLDLNKTDIVGRMFNTSKLIKDEDDNGAMKKYIESKIFVNKDESKFFMIENPYVDISTLKVKNEKGKIFLNSLFFGLILIFY